MAAQLELEMVSDREGITESKRVIPVGTSVEYMAHLSGEAIRIRLPDGSIEVMHPHCFKQLR